MLTNIYINPKPMYIIIKQFLDRPPKPVAMGIKKESILRKLKNLKKKGGNYEIQYDNM